MKIKELVYNRPNLIRSQVRSVLTSGYMLQFRIPPPPPNLPVYSVQCRQKVKLNSANVHSSIIAVHEREKESAIIMCVFSLVLAYVSVYIFVCICMFLYVFAKGCIFVSLSVCAGGEWGSVVCLCVEGPGCSPDFSWELQWSMASAETARASHIQAIGHTLMKQAIDTRIVLGCQSELEVQGIFRFIQILTFFQMSRYICKIRLIPV